MSEIGLVDGYVRVSIVGDRSGERFISPSIQREQIEGWAKLRGVEIGEIFEELDESGARADRPLLTRAVERVESGESNGIVVAKLDRFGRSLLDGVSKIERIQAAGGTFVSVQEGLDLGTPTGKFVLRLMLSMAEWELDRVRENWDAARERSIARGVYVSPAPVGYQRSASGRLRLDPVAGPLIEEVFRRRAEGGRWQDLCRFLEESGLKTGRGNSFWVVNSLRNLIRNRVYLGEARHGAHLNPKAHEPLVDAAIWHDAQHPRRTPSAARRSPLAGLLRCAGCRMAMHQTTGGYGGRVMRVYRCQGKSSRGPCLSRAAINADQLEPLQASQPKRRGAPRPLRSEGEGSGSRSHVLSG
jgi:DNA invertase Pin-like site-specific DNA recombinase